MINQELINRIEALRLSSVAVKFLHSTKPATIPESDILILRVYINDTEEDIAAKVSEIESKLSQLSASDAFNELSKAINKG
jgi:hypothetical protein